MPTTDTGGNAIFGIPTVTLEDSKQDLSDYGIAASRLASMYADWAQEFTASIARRKFRMVELDLDTMRKKGELESDETLISIRVVNDNIVKEQPALLSFITQANKLISILDQDDPAANTAKLEDEFTKGMKYHGYEWAWHSLIDGAQLHGWDAVEVCYDASKPLHVSIEHVGHDYLMFAVDSLDIQSAPYVFRKYMLSITQLKAFATGEGFDPEQVQKLIDAIDNQRFVSTVEVWKMFYKKDGIVYCGWLSNNKYATSWVKLPTPFYNGVRKPIIEQVPGQVSVDQFGLPIMGTVPQETLQEVYEEMYPIFIYRYSRTEDKKIMSTKGRAFYDAFRQEAQTALATAFITGTIRASQVYASVGGTSVNGATPKQDIKLVPGRICDNPLNFWAPPYPDAESCLGGLNWLDIRGQKEQGNYTDLLLQKKGQKTATEFNTAKEDKSFLQSTAVSLFSVTVREVYTYAFRIASSQAYAGLVPLAVISKAGDVTYVTDKNILIRHYDIRAAGDTEVVQKSQRLDKLMTLWPVIQNTPIAMLVLQDILTMAVPDLAPKYINQLGQASVDKQLLLTGSIMLQSILQAHPEELTRMSPEEQQQFLNWKANVQASLGIQQQPQGAPEQNGQQPTA